MLKTKSVSINEIANHPNKSLSPKDYIKPFPKWKKWFNKRFGYRKDYDGSLRKYLGSFFGKYFIHYSHYHDNNPKNNYGPRKIYHEGRYIETKVDNWTIPAPGKKSYETFSLTFFWYTFFAFKFSFEWSNSVFFGCVVKFSILKPNLQFKIGFQRNTA